MTDLLTRIQRRLDAEALVQLRAEAARLAAENESLREQLARAEDNADAWCREATELHLQLCEAHCGIPAITPSGQLVVAH